MQKESTITRIHYSNRFATVPFATAQSKDAIYASNNYLNLAVSISDVTSELRLGDIVYPESLNTMIASERVLAKDWDQPDEDAAWADL